MQDLRVHLNANDVMLHLLTFVSVQQVNPYIQHAIDIDVTTDDCMQVTFSTKYTSDPEHTAVRRFFVKLDEVNRQLLVAALRNPLPLTHGVQPELMHVITVESLRGVYAGVRVLMHVNLTPDGMVMLTVEQQTTSTRADDTLRRSVVLDEAGRQQVIVALDNPNRIVDAGGDHVTAMQVRQ